ncbi:hypothetical protein [Aneurinibacillus aneurinilyticus]|uniref:hypothetical protein n=2 Tax=Aneurinibacillus aneurinilyticus TaxID=1391 RepID=UPI003523F911
MQPHEQIEFELAIDEIKRNMDNHIKWCHAVSETMFEYYKALMDKGFNAQQALQIVIAHGINPGNANR